MTCKINADTTDGLKIVSDTSGTVDIQNNGTTIAEVSSSSLAVTVAGSGVTDALKLKTTATNSVPGILFSGDLSDSQLDVARIRGHQDSSTVSGLTFETKTGGTIAEKMRLTGAGNLGIGQTSPATKLDVAGNLRFSAGSPAIEFNNGGAQLFLPAANTLGFATGGGIGSATERARIDSAGRFLVGTTANFVNGSSAKSQISYVKNSEFGLFIRPSDNNTGGGQPALFQNQAGTSIGSIGATASNVSYNTSSDYRLKENVNYSFDATTRLKQLKPARFSWISDDTNTLIDGFLAHEVTSVVPDAVTGTKDATTTRLKTVKDADGNFIASDIEEADWTAGKQSSSIITDTDENTLAIGVSQSDWTAGKADGTYPNDSTWAAVDALYPNDSTWTASEEIPDYQSIDHSKLVPLLVKTIQELEARITALES